MAPRLSRIADRMLAASPPSVVPMTIEPHRRPRDPDPGTDPALHRHERPSRPSAASTSTSAEASWSPSSARTAPASRPACGCSPRCSRRPPAPRRRRLRHRARPGRGPPPHRVRRPGQRRRPHPAGPRRAGQPGPRPTGCAGARRAAGPTSCSTRWTSTRARRRGRSQHAVRRPAAPPRHRARAGAPAAAAVPGRAVDRAGPAEPGQPVGARRCGCAPSTGTTIFLTTHYLDEADTMAERVMVMDHGRVIADDTADRAEGELAGDRIVLGAADDATAPTAAARRAIGAPGRATSRRRTARARSGSRDGAGARCPRCCRASRGRASRSRPPRSAGRRSTTSSSP